MVFTCVLTAAVILSPTWAVPTEEAKTTNNRSLQEFLTTYLQNRLERAQLNLKQLQRLQESGVATLPDVLAAEDEIDKWRLHLRLAKDAKLMTAHPVFNELRKEFGVPEISKSVEPETRKLAAAAILEYLEAKYRRAQRESDWAATLYEYARGTESKVLAAKTKVEGLQLLLEAERLALRKSGE